MAMRGMFVVASLMLAGPVWADMSAGPIEMTGETLEWRQHENTAMFSGHVVVTRGDMTLKADTLTATYGKDKGQVDTLVAKGHVQLVRNKGTETATGDVATFEVAANKLTLTGSTVELTRGPSTLSGDKLVYDLKTGNARVTRAGGAVKARFEPSQRP